MILDKNGAPRSQMWQAGIDNVIERAIIVSDQIPF